MSNDRVQRRRRKLARAFERAAVPEKPAPGAIPYIVYPEIAVACAAPLHAIAAALRNGAHEIDNTTILGELQGFVGSGVSPFFGRDTDAACLEARRLEQLVALGSGVPPHRGVAERRRAATTTIGRRKSMSARRLTRAVGLALVTVTVTLVACASTGAAGTGSSASPHYGPNPTNTVGVGGSSTSGVDGSSNVGGRETQAAQATAAQTLAAQLAAGRLATAKYATNLDRAKRDGYMIITRDIPDMGWHFLNPKVTGFDIRRPPILVYTKRGSSWQLVAFEWVFPKQPATRPLPGATYGAFGAACHYKDGTLVFENDQSACATKSPQTGAAFNFWHPGLVTLHLWLWYPNPSGIYSGTNPLMRPFNGQ